MFEYTPLSTILNKQVEKMISGYNDQVVNEKVMVCSNVKLNL